jgi:hypothetical protein
MCTVTNNLKDSEKKKRGGVAEESKPPAAAWISTDSPFFKLPLLNGNPIAEK